MAYDEALAARIRDLLAGDPRVVEKRMFGGLAFIVRGHMAVGASGQGGLLVHVDPEDSDALTVEPYVSLMEMRGKSMKGWVRVGAEAVASEGDLERWVGLGVDHARSLPAK